MNKTAYDIVTVLMQYALYAAGSEDVPEQQDFAADCMEACFYIMDGQNIIEWKDSMGTEKFVWTAHDMKEKAEQFRIRSMILKGETKDVSC